MSIASETTALSVSSASPTKIMEKEKSDNSEMFQGNAEKKPAWNRLSNGESGIKPVMVASSSWPLLSEAAKAASCSSSDSLKSLCCDGSSSSVSSFSKRRSILAELEPMEQTLTDAISNINQGAVAQASGCPLPYTSPSSYNQRNMFASQSHVRAQNQHQQNSNNNQNVSYLPHQSHRGGHNQEHVNLPRNFNGLGGFVRPSPPLLVPPVYAQHMPPQPFYYPLDFTGFPPQMMYHPHRMPFMEPPPVLFPRQNPNRRMPSMEPPPVLVPSQKPSLKTKTFNQVQKAPLKTKIANQVQKVPLKTKILNQVQFYLSEDNLPNDVYLRMRMNDEGFVHIEFIAGFNKLKALTSNIQLILDSLQGSDMVEVKGYEIRNGCVWRKYVMPHNWRTTFYPSQEYVMANNHQHMQLEQKPEVGSSSSNQNDDNNNNNLVV
ncbi:BnaA09g09280D [Brassica napus]|uniref:BnaA09g09280D protein n=1 Tax=Brassica napus TaxID=3708 RepID=A0A078GYW8_BRANA|nr:la-related protein 1C-like [Brassica napus]CDY30349.1 BnaA09g09280D [Brassica napus]